MEKEQQQIQLNIDPNSYAITMVNMLFDEEFFHFMIASGNQGRQFVATPKHAKRIYLLLKQQIENYEKKFGEMKTQLPERPQNTQEESKVGF
ncbi:MAG: hypothetical protein A3C58_00905 [Candidatus Staskawiczbacteria bacterium RIFCSPHIGHO2_02_FULL_34_10]|uniref:DUF3467 domain-containing protein n=1 Tax=Candidatus Staskawiczbacteria bacterium RIFCSPHIGHO2_02_FULL_34_10 TaxID=1802205 RepID=A0A1G2HX56_9BACT|nr:MAG: hypothetical protein A3C58_00905 [Candidatus Staskawiczbacteria bacterium RIFCSPHIGHO2_02_FULL_34_10]